MWARGVDVLDDDTDGDDEEGRPVMGGVLHTEPILVNYAVDDNGTATDTDDTQTNVLFTTTNDGYLHILKSDDSGLSGKPRLEHSAVMPKQTLAGIDELYLNSGNDIAYRLDSNIDIWRFEDPSDSDDDITTGGNDHVYAYFGQRRGGNVIFAFDVTDPDVPELLWVIDPDTVPAGSIDPDIGPFQFMGQSWSKPKKHAILVPNAGNTDLEPREIVIFGGGYDHDSDDVPNIARNQDSFGSAIYIVDARTGELLWWAGHSSFASTVTPDFQDSDMQYGFAADIRIADINGDRFADKIFASDGGGQVWRFDIANALNSGDSLALSDRITGGVIADLQRSDPSDPLLAENNRRLYYAPDVAIVKENDNAAPIFTIAIGSGYRAHPLDKVIQDKFFVLKYDDVLDPPADGVDDGGGPLDGYDRVKIHGDDLLDITDLNFAADPPPVLNLADQEALDTRGWFINLANRVDGGPSEYIGEKALSESITVDGNVIFTTYTPPANDADGSDDQECTGNQGSGKTYVVSIIDGRPVANLDGVGAADNLELSDRAYDLKVSGVPPRPKVVFPDIQDANGKNVSGKIIVGRELLPVNIANAPDVTYWVQY
jgi:type IV pilus assembly protein PilY1